MSNISSKLANMRALEDAELKQVNGGCVVAGLLFSGGKTFSGDGSCMLDDEGLSATEEFIDQE